MRRTSALFVGTAGLLALWSCSKENTIDNSQTNTYSTGVIGSYTSVAAAPDGTVWVAGYNEADWNNDVPYGDLVVGERSA